MRFLPLIWRSLWLSKRRTLLTTLSIAASIFAVIAMLAFAAAMTGEVYGSRSEPLRRLVVRHAVGITFFLPEAYYDRIAAVPGVRLAVPFTWFGGYYQNDPRNFFSNFAVDADTLLELFTEYQIDPQQRAAFEREQTACIVGEALAKRFGWQLGDRVPMTSPIFRVSVDPIIRGIFSGPEEQILYFHKQWLDELGPFKGVEGLYWLLVDDPAHMAAIGEQIDAAFASSPAPTKTEPEQAFRQTFAEMLGNIKELVRNVGLAVSFAIFLVAANTMAMAIRERVVEVATLKAFGYRRRLLFGMLMSESLFISLAGGAVGTLGAWSLLGWLDRSAAMGPVENLHAHFVHLLIGMGIAVAVGVVSGLVPAWQASRLAPAEGLRRAF